MQWVEVKMRLIIQARIDFLVQFILLKVKLKRNEVDFTENMF